MRIMEPPLNSLERSTAHAATLAAYKQYKHVGIRPAEATPKSKTAGIRVDPTPTGTDDAIEKARQTWPQQTRWSVFGANNFTSSALLPISDDADGAFFSYGEMGDGCFEDASDVGAFSTPGMVDLANAGLEEGPDTAGGTYAGN